MSFDKKLDILKENSLYRKRNIITNIIEFPYIELNNKKLINFGSNNYLNLNNVIKDTSLQKSSQNGIVQNASPLIVGYTSWHEKLEKQLAKWKGQDDALVLSSGFLANYALFSTLADDNCIFIIDKASHASILEIVKRQGVRFRVFPHKNYQVLRKLLSKETKQNSIIYIVSDSLFSMDGDLADVSVLIDLAKQYQAYIVLDEAHAHGVYGINGAGLSIRNNINNYPKLVVTGTFSKSFSSYGGFISGSQQLIDLMVNKAKPYIYNTALPLIHVFSSLEALKNIKKGEAQKQLWKNIVFFVKKLNTSVAYSPIIPIIIGDNKKALQISKKLKNQGFFVPAIRYPTVAPKKAMLRISLSMGHTHKQLNNLAESINQFMSNHLET